MVLPFDAAIKNLLQLRPQDWLRFLGLPVPRKVKVLSPVRSVVLLLRKRADRGDLTGRVHYETRAGHGGMDLTNDRRALESLPPVIRRLQGSDKRSGSAVRPGINPRSKRQSPVNGAAWLPARSRGFASHSRSG
jgi:hypothetical protein